MTPEEVKELVANTPGMTLDQGRRITQFIADKQPLNVLELGTGHGVSTLYIASALQNQRQGMVHTVDRCSNKQRRPSLSNFLTAREELHPRILMYQEPTSYHYLLRRMLVEKRYQFDLVYLDDSHTWVDTGFGFLLAMQLLRPGGWFIFDDIHWTFAKSPTLGKTAAVQHMPLEEATTPQVHWVFYQLVETHPDIVDSYAEAGWGFAQKRLARTDDYASDVAADRRNRRPSARGAQQA